MKKRVFVAAALITGLAAQFAARAQEGLLTGEAAEKYTFRSGDTVQYRIAEDPVKARDPLSVSVTSVGEASFPVSRESDIRITLLVRGKTIAEVKEELSRRLLAEYYNKATVDLTLAQKQLTPGKIQFFGEMSATLPLLPDSPPQYLSDAILSMRPSDFADLRRVKVHRIDPVTQASRVITVNVRDILRNGKRDQDLVLQEGDRVEVPTKFFN